MRDILQNRTYLGKTKYQKYQRKSDGTRSFEAPEEWFEGQHEAVVDEDLFERCIQVRAGRRSHRQATPKYNPYLLRNLIFCWSCWKNRPEGKTFPNYGKMRPHAQSEGEHRYYRCRSRQLGYKCNQKGVPVEVIDNQVVEVLKNLKPPADWHIGITKAMGELLGEKNLEERLAEIRAIIKRMDTRWDKGFITDEEEYLEQRLKLQLELEQLTPVPNDDLERAVEMLEQFSSHWDRLEGDDEGRHELIKLIVERVFVEDGKVAAMTLRSNYHLVLGHKTNGPTEYSVDPMYTYGSDGHDMLSGCRCIIWVLQPDFP